MARRSNRRRKKRSWKGKLAFWTAWAGGISIVSAIALMLVYGLRANQFDIEEIGRMPQGAKVFDAKGRVITTLKGGRELVERDDIPEFLIDCLLAREDARFYEHRGVDWKGLIRATIRNLKDQNFTQGASTLSMQLARNTYEIRAKSIDRKLLEIALTKRVEARYSKNQIITQYLNRIYFGSGAYGIDAAAETYFGREVSNLSAGQCATLVGIIRGPHIFSPLRNVEGALQQRDQVLSRLIAIEKISESRATEIKAEPLALQKKTPDKGNKTYAVQAATRHLDEIVDDEQLAKDGPQIHTTLDLLIQARQDTFIDQALAALDKPDDTEPLQCAAVTIDTTTGAIRALCGGRDFSLSKFNRALDAKRAIGPAIEPFLNAIARERGKLPIIGKPVQVGRQMGETEFASLMPRLGFAPPYGTGDDIYRGTMPTSALTVATALATLAANGQFPRTFLIQKVSTKSGQILFENTPSFKRVLIPESAEEGLSLLGKKGHHISYAFGHRDLWILHTAGDLSSAFWFGYDSPAELKWGESTKAELSQAASAFK